MSCLLCAPAAGQSVVDENPPPARFAWGPFRANPTIALTNFGVDSNVFNSADVSHPQSDVTMTLAPGADAWFRLGRSRVTASVKEDLVYYQHFASERSVNGYYKVAAVVPLNRLSWNAGADYSSARDRPGFEIDARSLHREAGAHGGAEVRAFGKTLVAVTMRRSAINFEDDATFMGANLNHELSRTITAGEVSVRHQLTPVTAVTFDVSREDDRFRYSSDRDSQSTRVMGGVIFGTRLRGAASVGYRSFDPRAADVPAYHGLTANADVSFTTVGSMRIGAQVVRDVDYSYDVQQPYYVLTGVVTSFTHALVGPLNATARVGFQQLAYRGRVGLAAPTANRTDLVSTVGGSVGYRVVGNTRISFNVDKQQRNSDFAAASYGDLRYGTSVTYGF